MDKAHSILYVNRDEVEELLSYSAAVDLMRKAMIAVSDGKAIQPIRSSMAAPDETRLLGMMPGCLRSNGLSGIKVVTIFSNRSQQGHSSHSGLLLLFEAEYGMPLAILEAGSVTAIRTAACSVVATSALARRDATDLLVLGNGEQAQNHVEAFRELVVPDRIQVWGRSYGKAQAFADRQSEELGCHIEPARDLPDAVAAADIICTTTSAESPVLKGDWLKGGVHINLVGSSVPSAREIDTEGVCRSKFFVDYIDSVKELGGEYRNALAAGAIDESHILGEIGEVLSEKICGRESESDVTIFKSLGMISEDIYSAEHIYRMAKENCVGTRLEV